MDREIIVRVLEQFRNRLIFVVVMVFMLAIGCFYFIEEIRLLLTLPAEDLEMNMIYLTPPEALMANLRLAFTAAALISLPIILYQVVALIMAVQGKKRRSAFFLTFAMYFLFALGLSFAYFIVFPFALNFFLGFSAGDLVAEFSVARYISFATSFLFSFGLVFQLPLVFWFLGSIGLVSTAFLRRNRKFALLIIIIFSAVLTPPDIFSQVLMTIPLMILYEVGILMVYFTQRRRKNEEMYHTAG